MWRKLVQGSISWLVSFLSVFKWFEPLNLLLYGFKGGKVHWNNKNYNTRNVKGRCNDSNSEVLGTLFQANTLCRVTTRLKSWTSNLSIKIQKDSTWLIWGYRLQLREWYRFWVVWREKIGDTPLWLEITFQNNLPTTFQNNLPANIFKFL